MQRVIVEVTPRWREKMAVIADWSTPALKKQLLGRRVRITGWLFDDLEHEAQAENQPGRAPQLAGERLGDSSGDRHPTPLAH